MMRFFAGLIATGLSLAACAPMTAPKGLANETPAMAQASFTTRDGIALPLRHWDAREPHAIVVALHGMSDYSNAFAMPGPFFASQGITTYAYDQRGFGAAPNAGLWPGADTLRQDLGDAVEAVRRAHPGVPVFALGESMGGAVVLSSLASGHPPDVDGVILVAPAVWSRDDMPVSYRVALWSIAHTMPWLTVSGRGLNIWPSDNVEMLRKLARDPLFQHETRADAVYGLANLMDQARQAPAHLDHPPPILFLYGKKDQVIPAEPTKAVVAELGARADVHAYDYGYHMLLRDLDRQLVWNDALAWINQKTEHGSRESEKVVRYPSSVF